MTGDPASGLPRISIVTPCLNAGAFLDEALRSVLDQGYPNLEYMVIDGGSTDGGVDVIRRHEARLAWWVSEPDRGHADALNKGFARSTGEIMGWLNADDVLHRGALWLLADLFTRFPEVEWLTGQPSHLDQRGAIVVAHPAPAWSRLRFLSGDYRWIQQESTYWRRSLWQRTGARVSEEHSLALDFELWLRFFRVARLQSTEGLIGAFRFQPAQKTAGQLDEYERQANELRLRELRDLLEGEEGSAALRLREDAPPPLRFDWRTRSHQYLTASMEVRG
jgi:glycosyltransferase involved in cell wall biosynthesis